METTDSLLKSVIAAETQYCSSKIERNLVFLQRQIDVLISKTSRGCSLKFFNPSEVLAADCIACLVNLMSDSATKPSLILKCILLFNNLVTDNHIRECLHEKFQLTPALVGVVVNHGVSTSDTLTAEGMQLLQKVTYGHRISFQEPYMEDLVRFLLRNVVSPATGLTLPAMGILVNLTRDNFSVQSYIKNNENMKEFARTLIKLLGDQAQNALLFSLTLLLNVCPLEKMAAKFYNDTNVPQTFQMVFNVLIDGQSGDTRRYAVDLFKDILKLERLQKSLANYEYLGTCIEQTLNLLCTSSHESVIKVFEFLQILCGVKGVRRVVCKAMFATFHIQDPSLFASLAQTPLSRIADPLLATIHWAGQSTDTQGLAPLGAYDLLIEIYEEQIFSHSKMHYDKHVAAILPTALHTLETPLEGDNLTIERRCTALVRCVKLLLTFCSDDTLLTLISKQTDANLLSKLLFFQFDHNTKVMTYDVTPPLDDWSDVGVELVLYLLDLIAKLKIEVLEDLFITTMQETKVVPFLACGLCSTNRERVQDTLNLIQMCSKLEGFPVMILGDVLASQNTARMKKQKVPLTYDSPHRYPNKRIHLEDKENIPVMYMKENVSCKNTSVSDNSDAESIHSLIEKMNTGLGLKDCKESEIVAVYERSLQAMQTKEQHLQDLLDAKTLSLTQADRMLSQYRARKGQDEAECNRFRSLLIQAEKKCKSLEGDTSDMRSKLERCSKEIEDLHTENQKLRQVAQMHQQLTTAHTELTEKYESGQKALLTLRQEHQSLSEMHEMLQKHNTNLKHQFDNTMEQLTTLQDERRKVMTQLKTAETKLEDTKKASLKWEYDYKKSEEEREVMETSIETLRSSMAKSEAKKKQLQDQVSQLEFACNQHEQTIANYETEINDLKSEIAKHRQITALINSLSSGNASDTSGAPNAP
ncbi:protein CIP2A homolog [Mercenaria mercenaria]|uniref:protein CIP2A homolog n=1 Tax=Mercenaria mercenaria TaxID=6596 RepID=UPI00234F1689|nr:protein CIP2A homolog [Mercenaria mercenaria]XP_045197564.2 protein CIP2A homolog [Mercenaria mercenaria]XP_045197565.2 protein CIP2A homolog [Mercenaria mercenaria]